MKVLPVSGKLQLHNDGQLELVFLGVGSAFSKRLYQTNFILIKGDKHLLVDFGITGPVAISSVLGLETTDIEFFLPTHSHCDHIGGVEALALLNRYVGMRFLGRPKLTTIITEAYQDVLWNMSLRGGMEWNEINADGQRLSFEDFFTIIRPNRIGVEPRERWQVEFGDMHIELFRTNHVPEQALSANEAFISYGLYIDNRLFISGDTKFDSGLIEEYAFKSEVMFHDAQAFLNPVHASIDELSTLDSETKAKMYLMHYPDAVSGHQYPGFAGLAQQGVRYIFD